MNWFFLLVIATVTALLLFLLLRTGTGLRIAADVPNYRSLHQQPIPRIGGVVTIPVALLPAIFLLPDLRVVAFAGLLLWTLSFIDDRNGLPIGIRFFVHVCAASVVLLWPSTISTAFLPFVLLVVIIVWGTNLYNFMDGADGLAGGMAVIGFFAYAISAIPFNSELAILAAALSASSAGFLLFNFPPAKIFLGDAGSIPLGFFAAIIGIHGWHQMIWPIWFPFLVFSPFVVDATATLLKRAFRGDRFWHPHREHYYQRLVLMGWSHRRLALSEYMLMIGTGLSATVMLKLDQAAQFIGLLLWLSLYVAAMVLVDVYWKRHQAGETKS